MVLFAMLGTIMFVSKIVMEALPNIHLLGTLTMTYTVVYRKKALIPLYVYVFLNGLYAGFSLWWVPYLYIWTILWGITMLLPRKMPRAVSCVVYPLVCGVFGILFGILYAPAQAIMFNLDFNGMIAWIMSGVPFDLLSALGNAVTGLLIVPLSELLFRLEHTAKR
jgi:energy-coupling factor transport system substrate-specific component